MKTNHILFTSNTKHTKPVHSNFRIAAPLMKLIERPKHFHDIEIRGEFAKKWADNPQGAIVTLADILAKASIALDTKPTLSKITTQETTDKMHRYLQFFRRENFWDPRPEERTRLISRILDEFRGQTRRDPNSQSQAQALNLPASEGAWRGLITLIRDRAKQPVLDILEQMNALVPISSQHPKPILHKPPEFLD